MGKITLDLGGPSVITRSLKVERGGRRERPRETAARGLSLTLLALKMEERHQGSGRPGNLWKLEKARKQIFPRASKRNVDLLTL